MSKIIKLNQEKKNNIYDIIFNCQDRKEKKQVLIQFSKLIKLKMETGDIEKNTINESLIDMYSNEKHQEFYTFKDWKKKGYKVKKGSKAFFVWSKPIKATKKNEKKEMDEKTEDKYKFFGIAYLFSNNQVESLNNN